MSYSLRDRRLELSLTLEDVAKSVGVGKSTVRKWETGDIQNMGRDKILALARTLKISPIDIIDPKNELPSSLAHEIMALSNKLTPTRQQAVYSFASDQLKEQQQPTKVVYLDDAAPKQSKPEFSTVEVELYGTVSAGSGEFQVDEDSRELVCYNGPVPPHDYALQVNGDSMYPMLENGQIIFIKRSEGDNIHTGQIVIAVLNDMAFVKKIDLDDGHCRLVSLNPKYKPIEVSEDDEFQIQGVVIL